MYPDHPSVEILCRTLYSFHMALFMLISGYLFYTAYFDAQGQPKKGRLYRQLLDLIIVYTVFDIPFGVFKIICSRFTVRDVTWIDVLLFPVRPIAHYWYIYTLILFYIVFSQKVVYRRSKTVSCVVLLACLLGTFVHTDIFASEKFLYYASFFWIGICYRRGTAPWFGNKAIATIFFAASSAVYVLTYGTDIPQNIPGIQMVIALGISQGIWCAFEHISVLKNNRLLSFFGRHSLEIYLIHNIFTTGARTVFPDFILDHYVLSAVLNFALGTSLPILIAHCCKKLSVYDLFFKPVTLLEKSKKHKQTNGPPA